MAKEGAKFALVNGKAVELKEPFARSSQTLLRDFDPIFEREAKVDTIAEEDDDDSDTSSVSSSTSSSEADGATSLTTSSAINAGFEILSEENLELDPLKEVRSRIWILRDQGMLKYL